MKVRPEIMVNQSKESAIYTRGIQKVRRQILKKYFIYEMSWNFSMETTLTEVL